MRDKGCIVRYKDGIASVIPLLSDTCINCNSPTCAKRGTPFLAANPRNLDLHPGDVVKIEAPASIQLAQGIFSLIVDEALTRKYRKIYDAEDAERLAKAMKEEQIEAEKELQRALKRAANPDGITQNTSKKKLQQQKQQAEEAAKAAAAKEYAAKKGEVEVEVTTDEKAPKSGVSDRPYCKGRAYDPNRYRNTTEE